jgi:hypothetical protein
VIEIEMMDLAGPKIAEDGDRRRRCCRRWCVTCYCY